MKRRTTERESSLPASTEAPSSQVPTNTTLDELGKRVAEEEGPEIVDHTSAGEDFVAKNKGGILLGIFLIMALTIGIFLFRHFRAKKAAEAAMAFTAAESVEDFDDIVIQDHAGSLGAGNAFLMKAQALLDDDKKAEASSALTSFVNEYSGHPRRDQALLALATIAESEGKSDEARGFYDRVISEHPQGAIAPLAEIRKGDLLLAAGDEAGAIEIYQNINSRYPRRGQAVIGKVDQRLQLLRVEPEEVEITAMTPDGQEILIEEPEVDAAAE